MKELRIALRDFEKYKEKNKDDLYGISCYKVALKLMKAFDKEMEKKKHSGLAVGFIKSLLKSWLSENSISPIEDDDFKKCDTLQFGVEVYYFEGIFKYVYPDGKVEYYDADRVVYHDTYDGKDVTWHSAGDIDKIVDEYVGKITMPYKREKIHVYGEDKYLSENGEDLTKEHSGVINYRYIKYILKEDGTKIIVNKEIRQWEKF